MFSFLKSFWKDEVAPDLDGLRKSSVYMRGNCFFAGEVSHRGHDKPFVLAVCQNRLGGTRARGCNWSTSREVLGSVCVGPLWAIQRHICFALCDL